jgi:hypothetical protein
MAQGAACLGGRRPLLRLLSVVLLLALLPALSSAMNNKWKEWWKSYDVAKPPQYWQLPWAAAPSMKDYASPSSPFPEPPPPTAQGFQGTGHFWPPPPPPPPAPPPPLPPPPTAPTKKSYQSTAPQLGGGAFSGAGLDASWSGGIGAVNMPPTAVGGFGGLPRFRGAGGAVNSKPASSGFVNLAGATVGGDGARDSGDGATARFQVSH